MKKTRWHSCNVLRTGDTERQLWQFESSKGGFALRRESAIPSGSPLPEKQVGKDWHHLIQPRLNIAWFPPDKVFLRVAHLPKCDFSETVSMIELQLEKLSPLPVAQISWSFHVLPHPSENLQTVIIIIVARDEVEELLGTLEGQGYLPDRLELPLLDQCLATPITGDGVWLYPLDAPDRMMAVAAWWYGGTLQNLGFITLPPGENRPAALKEQLAQMAWAGELEGWLASPPRWHLVAEETRAQEWQEIFAAGLGEPLDIVSPVPPSEVAGLSVRRTVVTDPKINLLPFEYLTRYQQRFVDRIWMRGLGAVIVIYMFGVLIYFGALYVQTSKASALERDVKQDGVTYTNALQLKQRYEVLKEREELKYAALECWKATAQLLPEEVTLQGLDLKGGKTFTLNGTAPADKMNLVNDFFEQLRKTTVGGQPLFAKDKGTVPGFRTVANTTTWSFSLELKRAEE